MRKGSAEGRTRKAEALLLRDLPPEVVELPLAFGEPQGLLRFHLSVVRKEIHGLRQ